MEILVIGCIHNDIENMLILFDKVSSIKFDVIVCPGDFTDYSIPKGFTRSDVAELIIEEVKTFGKPILAVPGSWDEGVNEILEKEKMSIHGKGVVVGGIGFYGFGGARTPFNTLFEPTEEEIEKGLKMGLKDIRKIKMKVQVTHMPPARTKLDVIFSGAHVGSEAIRSFIEKNKPNVAISSHIHEAKGVDELGETKLINSGRFPEGHCGLVSLRENFIEMKNINLV